MLLYRLRLSVSIVLDLLLCILLLTSCKKTANETSRANEVQNELSFSLPDIPDMLQEPGERMDYLVHHYWDKFDFTDTLYIGKPEVTEQALVDYLDLLSRVSQSQADSCITGMLRKASHEPLMLSYFTEMLGRYYMEPNSPMHSEEAYKPVAEFLISSANTDETLRTRAAFDLKKIMLNRKGSTARNFTYTLASGKQYDMHGIKSEYLLLIFYDTDCESCSAIINQMTSTPMFTSKSFLDKVKVLAIYPGDDIESWKAYRKNIPAEWINACDRDAAIINKMLYNLEVMPSIYIMDRNKHVIIKDASLREVTNFFSNI